MYIPQDRIRGRHWHRRTRQSLERGPKPIKSTAVGNSADADVRQSRLATYSACAANLQPLRLEHQQ